MRFNLVTALGGALLCGVIFAACGGGGGSATGAGGAVPAPNSGGASAAKPGTKIVITIDRGAHRAHPASVTRHGAGTLRREYVSQSAEGLQVTVASGSASQSIYADISSNSSLCTTSNSVETCTVTVPTLGAQETFSAMETDQTPIGEGQAPYEPGYGSGFSDTTNILAAISQSESLQLGGQATVGLTLGPVVAFFYDCSGVWTPPPALSIPPQYSANFGDDGTGFNDTGNHTEGGRIVVTAGVTSTGTILANFCDAAEGYTDTSPTSAPFVDVNASPVPLTFTSNSSQVTVAPIINNGTPPPSTAYAATATIPSDAYYWDQNFLMPAITVSSSYSPTSTATVTFNNNLTATNPYTGQTVDQAFAGSMPYYVAAIAASSYSFPSVAANGTATVTGTDEGAAYGMQAESAYETGDGFCNNASGTTLATVASAGAISESNWQQSFTITAGSTAGTCTFYLYDVKAKTITQPISVTVL